MLNVECRMQILKVYSYITLHYITAYRSVYLLSTVYCDGICNMEQTRTCILPPAWEFRMCFTRTFPLFFPSLDYIPYILYTRYQIHLPFTLTLTQTQTLAQLGFFYLLYTVYCIVYTVYYLMQKLPVTKKGRRRRRKRKNLISIHCLFYRQTQK